MFQSLGNHEFDNGVSGLTPFIENINTPVLCSNLILNKEPELAREENLKKSVVLDVEGVKVGIVGYLTPDTKFLAVPNDVEYIDEVIAMKEEVTKLQNQGIKIIIGLGHSGFSRDLEIAREVDGLDLVIGGHTNTFLWNGTSPDSEHVQGPYPTFITQASGRRVPVVQAYAYTKYLGRLHIKFDSDGETTHIDGIPIILDRTVPQDQEVLNLLDRYRENILLTTEDVLGKTSVILDGECSQSECNLGNLITDAMVYHYAINYNGEHWTDAPIAIIQAGGIRTSVVHATYPTSITKGDLLGVMPFEGNMSTLTMNGSMVLKMLEHSVSTYDNIEVAGSFLQLSGIKVTYNVRNKVGSRVVKAEARCWTCDVPQFYKVQEKDIYKVIMPGFVSKGGDGFSMFTDLPSEPLGFSELTCTQSYVSRRSPIYPQVEGRITILKDSELRSSSSVISVSFSLLLLTLIHSY